MRILIAPDSFKDSLSALEVGKAFNKGLLRANDQFKTRIVPLADGGEGTVQALVDGCQGSIVQCPSKDPIMRPITSFYGHLEKQGTAVIEIAAASGIELLKKEERNPWTTSTFGTGMLIKEALSHSCETIIIGIGGSATNDGGFGMAQAMGVRFYDKSNQELKPGLGGGALSKIRKIDLQNIDHRIQGTEILVACDVTNPLTGPHGASFVYGPQKGADSKMVAELDNNLKHFSTLIKEQLGIDISTLEGAGAAGGLGGGLVAFLGAKLMPGFQIVEETTQLEKEVEWADIVITGEGKMDQQTKFGKTPMGVARLAQLHRKPVIGIAGTLGEGYTELYEVGFNSIFSILNAPMTLETAIQNSRLFLEEKGLSIGRLLSLKL